MNSFLSIGYKNPPQLPNLRRTTCCWLILMCSCEPVIMKQTDHIRTVFCAQAENTFNCSKVWQQHSQPHGNKCSALMGACKETVNVRRCIDSPPVQHSLQKQQRGTRRKQAEVGADRPHWMWRANGSSTRELFPCKQSSTLSTKLDRRTVFPVFGMTDEELNSDYQLWWRVLNHPYCCNHSAGVALNARFTTNGMCSKKNTIYM